MVFRFKSI